jgi:ABC-type Fe3+/spermidine/putrescine transport system ATPase subunit
VTHDQEEALVMSDRVVLMNRGKVIQDDEPARIYHHPQSRFAATFIGESNIIDGTVAEVRPEGLRVDCGGCRFSVKAVAGAEKGDQVCLAIRLDKVKRLTADATRSFDNVVSGKIEEVVFYGSIIKFYVSAGHGLRLLVEEKREDEDDSDAIGEKNIGETVRLGFQARDAEVFREGGGCAETSP